MTARAGRLVQVIHFSGLKPVTDTTPAATFTLNDSSTNDVAEVLDGASPGMETIASRSGQFESISIANKTHVTLNAMQSGDSARLDVGQLETGMGSLAVNAGGAVVVHQAILPGVQLSLTSTADQVVELGPIVLGQQGLSVAAGTRVSLANPGNVVGGFSAVAHGGSVNLGDDSVDALTVGPVSATGDVTLVNAAGAVTVTGAVSAGSSSSLSVTSRQGESMISLSGGGSLIAQEITLTADSMTLAGGSVVASDTVTLAPFSAGQVIDLGDTVTGRLSLLSGDLAAITAGIVMIGGPTAGQIIVTEPVSEPVDLILQSGGGMTRTSAGTLSAPALLVINGGATPRTWTITPTSVGDGSGFSIPYTAGTLSITGGSGGDQFNATAAPSTHYVLDGGPRSSGTLHYDAQGRAISGAAPAAPSGEIDSPTVKPVTFVDMAAVTIVHAATATLTVTVTGSGTVTGGGSPQLHCPSVCSRSYPLGSAVVLRATPAPGSRFAGWRGAGCSGTAACSVTLNSALSVRATFVKIPRCVLSAPSSAVSHPRSSHSRPGKPFPAILTLRATCDQSAAATITVTITEVLRPGARHSKAQLKTVRIPPTHASLTARRTTSLTTKIPASAAKALAAHIRESASVTLTATNANGSSRTSLTLHQLRF